MDPKNSIQIKNLLSDKDQPIVIITHTNPDGDALGSSLGLYGFLKLSGFQHIQVITPDPYPTFLKWMPWEQKIIVGDRHFELAQAALIEANLIFCLDFNGFSRVGHLEDSLRRAKGVKILIDHHPQPEDGFDIVFSETQVSSTAELLYDFIVMLGGEKIIDQRVAECLYTGIVTDTGSFSYSCNLPKTYEITASLMALGVDGEKIHRLIYNTYSTDRMRLLGYCLSEKLRVLKDYNTAYISLSAEELQRFNYQVGDTEGVVNFALSLKDIKLAALFTENADHVKISFRSTGNLDVNSLARKHFHGGGHRNASGGKSFANLPETIKQFEEIIKKAANNDDFH